MPKEITHWLIANETARSLSDHEAYPLASAHNSMIQTVVKQSARFGTMLALGAVFHDVLYYVMYADHKKNAVCDTVADALHGAFGEDTFHLVRELLELSIYYPEKPHIYAFLLGAITHICADVTFHPYIYYTSGNWHSKTGLFRAQTRHRQLEAEIDIVFCKERQYSLRDFSLRSYLSAGHEDLREILRLLSRTDIARNYIPDSEKFSAALERGYRQLALIRPLLRNTLANTLVHRIEPALSARLRTYTALRYATAFQQSPLSAQLLPHTALEYMHPITGQAHQTTLTEMFHQAVQESVRVCVLAANAIAARKPELFDETGKSLEVGLHGVPASAMRYFASENAVLQAAMR